jgi:hypothetical protein
MMTFAVIQRKGVDKRRSEGRGAVGLNEDAPAVATTTATAAALRRMEQVISGKSRLRRRGAMDGWVQSFI